MAVAPTVTAVAFCTSPLIGTTYTAGERICGICPVQTKARGRYGRAAIGAHHRDRHARQAGFSHVFESNRAYVLFSYIVQSSDTDADGISIAADALSLNGGTITLPRRCDHGRGAV